MKTFLLILTVAFIFGHLTAGGQTKKFRWTNELCEFEGTYEAKKYSEAELKNTADLIFALGFPLETQATAGNYEDIANLSVEALDREYRQKSEKLKNLDIVDSPDFETLRRKKLKELEQVYRLSRATVEAYGNPAALLNYQGADACVAKYAAPLIKGGDDLLGVWRAVNEESRRKNADPQRIESIFNRQMQSSGREKFARVEVMAFGWWNCANEFIEYVGDDDRRRANFKKLFTKTRTVSCDEP